MKKVAILQSNYIPWKGYFDMIAAVDEFILFDDVQYTRRDWRNRNQIKTPQGVKWLTVPVKVKGKYYQTIRETEIDGATWASSHWKIIVHNYSKAHHFQKYKELFESLYLGMKVKYLSEVNYKFLNVVCDILGIKTKISQSMDYQSIEGKTDRLIGLCKQAGASDYLSGPAAKCYIDEDKFREAGIRLEYMDYSGYPEYSQLFPPFEHAVSIVDLIFNEGPEATKFMKSF